MSKPWVKIIALVAGLSLLLAGCAAPGPGRESGRDTKVETFSGSLTFDLERRPGRPGNSPAWPFLRNGPDGRLYLIWTEKTPGAGAPPEAGAGHAHGSSGHPRAAFLAASDDDGQTWSESVRVNDQAEDVQGDENEPKIAFGRGGQIYAAWAIPNKKGDKMRSNIRFTTRTESGRFKPARSLNEVPDAARFPALQVAPDGTVFVAWIDRRVDGPAFRQIYLTRISPSGTVLTSNYQIADDSCECCRITLAFAGDGKTVYATYRQKTADNTRNIVIRKSTDGGATFGGPVAVSDDGWKIPGCPHSGAVMAVDAAGNVHVIWYTYGRKPEESGTYYSVSTDGGTSFAPRRLVHAAGGPEILRPYLATGERGEVYLAWTNLPPGQERTQIFFRYLPAGGKTLSPVQQLSQAEGNAIWPNVAVSKDKVYVAWTETKGENSWIVTRAASLSR